jgi:hypothetical protein
VRFRAGYGGGRLQDFEWAYISIGSFTTDAVEAMRACMSAVARKRTNSRSSRYVRFVPIGPNAPQQAISASRQRPA